MLIDGTHRKWMVATLVVLLVASAAYVPYYLLTAGRVSGGSVMGIVYGTAAFGLMLFAGLLGLRKKFPVWRVGRAQTWMRGHLWLGLLSFPLVLLHSGFSLGGTLTTVLMLLALLVTLSGLFGTALQHYLPQLMTAQLPMETIFEEIDSVRRQLSEEAQKIVADSEAALAKQEAPAAPAVDPSLPKTFQLAAQMDAMAKIDKSETVFMLRPQPKATESLRSFYTLEVAAFLENPAEEHLLAGESQARVRFEQLRKLMPPHLQEPLADLESICEEARQLNRQVRMHHWLHGWLLFHIPISYALLLLGAVHAFMALRY